MRQHNFLAETLCVLVITSLLSVEASAKGGSLRSDDRYNPQHIESLPSEIRDSLYRICSTPKGLHEFATYPDDRHILLHFERFYCDQSDAFCKPSGCLHKLYGSAGGRYRLLRSYYAPPGQ